MHLESLQVVVLIKKLRASYWHTYLAPPQKCSVVIGSRSEPTVSSECGIFPVFPYIYIFPL